MTQKAKCGKAAKENGLLLHNHQNTEMTCMFIPVVVNKAGTYISGRGDGEGSPHLSVSDPCLTEFKVARPDGRHAVRKCVSGP